MPYRKNRWASLKWTLATISPAGDGIIELLYQQDLADLDNLLDYIELEPVHMLRGPAPGKYQHDSVQSPP